MPDRPILSAVRKPRPKTAARKSAPTAAAAPTPPASPAAHNPARPASPTSSSANAARRQEAASLRNERNDRYDTLPELRTDSLAFSLNGAAQAIALVKQGSALPQALTRIFSRTSASPQARGAMQDIAYRTLRQRGRVDALINLLTTRAPEPATLYGLLASALTLVVDPEDTSYEAFTVVDQAVTAASSNPEVAHAKGMINAVLRRFLREREALLAEVMKLPEAIWNFPTWWIDATRSAYPQQWEAILRAGNSVPPLTLRVNQRKNSTEDYLRLLADNGLGASRIGPYAVQLAQPVGVHLIPGFSDGLVSVQDAAAQLAVPLLDLQDGMRVLDACAAPGGKTGHILESATVELTALDSDAARLPRIEQNLQRLQLGATMLQGDASKQGWWDGRLYDRVLADVPCTASGIVRRHPDIRWLRRRADATQLAILSGQILDNLWQMVKPGGKLLFVTCSVWPQESEGQAAAFAVRQKATRLPAPGQLLPTASVQDNHDGLFYALFEKPVA